MRQWHCTTFYIFAFDVILCYTVVCNRIAVHFFTFLSLSFYYYCSILCYHCSVVSVNEIKVDWVGLDWICIDENVSRGLYVGPVTTKNLETLTTIYLFTIQLLEGYDDD